MQSGLDKLPPEIIQEYVFQHLRDVDTGKLLQVSSGLHQLGVFNAPMTWARLIETEFGIPLHILMRFAKKAKEVTSSDSFDFRFIYLQLMHLKKIEHRLPKYLKFSYKDPCYYFQLLACCFDHTECARQVLPPNNEEHMWIEFSIYAGFNNVAELGDRDSIDDLKRSCNFVYALRAGNEVIARQLFLSMRMSTLKESHLGAVASSGNLALFKWVLNNVGENIKCNEQFILCLALESGSVDLINFLIDNFQYEYNEDVLRKIIVSDNLSSVKRIFKRFNILFTQADLLSAAGFGCMTITIYMIEKLKMQVSEREMEAAALSGNLELFKYFLFLIKDKYFLGFIPFGHEDFPLQGSLRKDHVKLCLPVFSAAVQSGNMFLVNFCLTELFCANEIKNIILFSTTKTQLACAIRLFFEFTVKSAAYFTSIASFEALHKKTGFILEDLSNFKSQEALDSLSREVANPTLFSYVIFATQARKNVRSMLEDDILFDPNNPFDLWDHLIPDVPTLSACVDMLLFEGDLTNKNIKYALDFMLEFSQRNLVLAERYQFELLKEKVDAFIQAAPRYSSILAKK